MGERKGQNIWIPPDFDPAIHGSRNGYHGVHALRERAHKLHLGILIIRFEAPWNFWCNGCGSHVERGVRYNAEKKKVGNYYTTPIFAFRMKCHLCDNYFTFETDPKNCEYKITEGARRKIETWDPSSTEVIHLPDADEKAKRASDAMYRLEHDASDQAKAKKYKPAIVKLMDLKKQTSSQDYDTNARLRAHFRTEKKRLKKLKDIDDELKAKASLEIDLVPEHVEDIAIAQATTFQAPQPAAKPSLGGVFSRRKKRDKQTQLSATEAAKKAMLKTARRQVKTQSIRRTKASLRDSLGLKSPEKEAAARGQTSEREATVGCASQKDAQTLAQNDVSLPLEAGLVGDYGSSDEDGDNA
eukprot:TRINITY_DN12113_c0_g1_i2.p1 TRINITY_DN12113_c0_g1~~TRINITY_DN12113_c0_g1_i2.p1  ORF type:complete len:356 (+),score=79.66 TRINITY_DN12113_c0_g1_i2:2321-3388(+)